MRSTSSKTVGMECFLGTSSLKFFRLVVRTPHRTSVTSLFLANPYWVCLFLASGEPMSQGEIAFCLDTLVGLASDNVETELLPEGIAADHFARKVLGFRGTGVPSVASE